MKNQNETVQTNLELSLLMLKKYSSDITLSFFFAKLITMQICNFFVDAAKPLETMIWFASFQAPQEQLLLL